MADDWIAALLDQLEFGRDALYLTTAVDAHLEARLEITEDGQVSREAGAVAHVEEYLSIGEMGGDIVEQQAYLLFGVVHQYALEDDDDMAFGMVLAYLLHP